MLVAQAGVLSRLAGKEGHMRDSYTVPYTVPSACAGSAQC